VIKNVVILLHKVIKNVVILSEAKNPCILSLQLQLPVLLFVIP